MTFRMGKRVATEMHLGSKEVYQVRQGEALVYAKQLTVSQTLDGVTSDAPSSVAWGDGMVVTFTLESGKTLLPSTVRVTMGGADVTDTAFDFGTKKVTLASVTGNVTIEAIGAAVDAEVEYLESDGTAYINLMKTLNSDTDVIDIDFRPVVAAAATRGIFGARAGASSRNFSILDSSSNSIVVDVNNGSYATYRIMASTSAVNVRCLVHAEKSNKSIKYDGVQVASSTTSSQSFTTAVAAYLFATNGLETLTPTILYSFQWWRNGDLLFDLIPIRKNGVGYLYDRVSGELFGNAASSGAFTYGNDK